MTDEFRIEARIPTVDEFLRIVRGVGWSVFAAQERSAFERGLAASLFAVCAVSGDQCVGCARVVGDGALHFYVEEVAVLPEFQGRGLGRRLMEAVVDWLRVVATPEAAVELLTGSDRAAFYARFGFAWEGAGIMRWRPQEPDVTTGLGDDELPAPEAATAPLPGPDVEVVLERRPPTPAEQRRLFAAVGWDGELPDDDEELAVALDRSLFAVCAVAEGAAVGCARIVGDGAVYLYIQDVIVLPAWQGTGLGDRLMRAVMSWLDACCPPNAFVALFAAPGKDEFYRRYGFERRPDDEPGMAQQWRGPGAWRHE